MTDVTTTANKQISKEQAHLIANTLCRGTSADELKLFLYQCQRTGLDPFARQIYAIKRWDAAARKEVMGTQVSIDGLRLVAERTGEYEGQTAAEWHDGDGWIDFWNDSAPPGVARVGVWRKGFKGALYGVASWIEFVQNKKDGSPNRT